MSSEHFVGIDEQGVIHEWEGFPSDNDKIAGIKLTNAKFRRIKACDSSRCYAIDDDGKHYLWTIGNWPNFEGEATILQLIKDDCVQDMIFGQGDDIIVILKKDSK